MVSMFHFLKGMKWMLLMWLIGLYYRCRQKENFNRNLNAICNEKNSCFRTKRLSKLKCNGSSLGPIMLRGKWLIICGLCILHYFLVKENEFWYMHIFIYGYCFKYDNELCYKFPISDTVVILLCLSCLFCFLVGFPL